MRLRKYIAFAGMAVLMLCSCNEMENAPTNKFTDNSYWTSTTKAQYVVNMAYSQMYNAGRMWSDESLSDNAYDGRSVDDQRAIRKGMATPSLDIFKNEWKDLYGGIKTCHVFLEKVDLVPNMDASVKARMIAEIRYIRASLYFRLTNLYGAVPFFTEDITLEESRSVSRTDRETIISFIHQELEDIKDALPTRDQLPEEDKGKITKGAVCALQARVYLMDSDWNNVMLYCDNLMNKQGEYGTYALFPDYAGLFDEANEYNEEIIMDRSYVPNLITWGEMVDMIPLSRGGRAVNRVPQQSLVDTYLMLSGKTISEAGTDYNPAYPYDNRDPRLTATIIYDGYDWSGNVDDGSKDVVINIRPGSGTDAYDGGGNGTSTGYFTRKYYNPQAPGDQNSGMNIITMRYADILLMYAEALNELNNGATPEAEKAVEDVRLRAFNNDASKVGTIPSGYEEFKNFIIQERKLELSNEGLRKSDLARWGILVDYLTTEKEKLVQLAKREGRYANVDVYRAYKLASTPSFADPTIALPYISITEQDLVDMGLSETELTTMHTLNSGSKGAIKRKFFEADGKVYFKSEDVPADAKKVEEVEYTILNMFSINSIKQKGNLCVEDVEGLSSNNAWITGKTGVFYGMKKNMVEILPFNTTNIIDVNPGLAGQQHPSY